MFDRTWGRYFEASVLAAIILGVVAGWIFSEPDPYRSTSGKEVDAADRYQYQPDPGCTPHELRQLPSALDREVKRRECANQAQDHRREIDDLTQQTRAAEAVEKANWIAENNWRLSRIQLALSIIVAGLVYLTFKATRDAVDEAKSVTQTTWAALQEAKRANQIAAEAAELDSRPWLYVEIGGPAKHSLGDGPVPKEGTPVLGLTIPLVVRNSGKTPARNVIVTAHLQRNGVYDRDQAPYLANQAPYWDTNPRSVPPNGVIKIKRSAEAAFDRDDWSRGFSFFAYLTINVHYARDISSDNARPFHTYQSFWLHATDYQGSTRAIIGAALVQGKEEISAAHIESDMT